MEAIKKFVIIGPESTGKSTLCAQLAQHYHTLWVKEYAREFLEKNVADYNYDDLLSIAKGQIDLEEDIKFKISGIKNEKQTIANKNSTSNKEHETSGIFFIDTDMYVMKVWCEFVFNKCHNWILNKIAERHYDGYLLCNNDLPWVKDNLREYPDEKTRNKLYKFYKDLMVNQSVPWVAISGNYDERIEKAIQFISAMP